MAVIVPQACHRVASALERRTEPLGFPVLCDPDRSSVRAYGVWHPVGLDAFNTAHPASFLLDDTGRVRYCFVGRTQFARAPLARILEAAAAAAT